MRKVLHVIGNLLVFLITVLAVGMMIFTVVSVNTFDRTDRSLFGYKAFIVLSDSMSATDFAAGDLVLVKEVDPAALKEGDIIAYQSVNAENYGEIVTHKIRKLTTDALGNPGFVTYGTSTGKDDENIVTYDFVVGKYQTSLPGVGRFFYFLKTVPGYILCIFLPFFLLILLQGINSIRLFKQYKKEQLKEIEAERQRQEEELTREMRRLNEERVEVHRMMNELIKMRDLIKQKQDLTERTLEVQKGNRPEKKEEGNESR